MSSKYQVENRLRPIHEYYSAIVLLGAVVAFLLLPEWLMLSNSIGYGFALVCFTRALFRYTSGRRIAKYQNNLWRYRKFTLPLHKLPNAKHRIYLGHGFEWTISHTQRLTDINLQTYYGRVPSWYKKVYDLKIRHFKTPIVAPALKLITTPSRYNPLRPSLPPNGSGSVNLHAVNSLEGDSPVYLPDAQRTGHLGIFGTTGVGKTVVMANMIRQDIAAGHVVIVADPKGDAAMLSACYNECVRSGRLDSFHFFHLGFPEASSAYSPIATFSRVTEVATRLATLLPGDGQSLAFREFAWRLVNLVARTMTALGNKIDIEDIGTYCTDIDPLAEQYLEYYLNSSNHDGGHWKNEVEQIIEKSKKPLDRLKALCFYFKANKIDDALSISLIKLVMSDRNHLDKLTSSLLPLIDKLTTGSISQLLTPEYGSNKRRSFTLPELINSNGVAFLGFDSQTDAVTAQAVSNSLFADLTSTIGDIYKHTPEDKLKKICIYADEIYEMVGPQFTQLLNKGRGAGCRITTAGQTLEDFFVGYGDKDKAGQAIGNYNSMFFLRSRNLKTAELLTEQLREAPIHRVTPMSAARDFGGEGSSGHFASTNSQLLTIDNVKMLEASSIASLPPGEAFALIDGGSLYKVKIPMLETPDEPKYASVGEVIADMHRQEIDIFTPPKQSESAGVSLEKESPSSSPHIVQPDIPVFIHKPEQIATRA